ncbi:MAG: hypothetical protein MJB57_18140 [Gemmatimonadetes bacterium]|nr:hypothetical protein [Gemmatimonadota bacterium]
MGIPLRAGRGISSTELESLPPGSISSVGDLASQFNPKLPVLDVQYGRQFQDVELQVLDADGNVV